MTDLEGDAWDIREALDAVEPIATITDDECDRLIDWMVERARTGKGDPTWANLDALDPDGRASVRRQLFGVVNEFNRSDARSKHEELFKRANDVGRQLSSQVQADIAADRWAPDMTSKSHELLHRLLVLASSAWDHAPVVGETTADWPSACHITSSDYWAWWYGHHVVGMVASLGREKARIVHETIVGESMEETWKAGWWYSVLHSSVISSTGWDLQGLSDQWTGFFRNDPGDWDFDDWPEWLDTLFRRYVSPTDHEQIAFRIGFAQRMTGQLPVREPEATKARAGNLQANLEAAREFRPPADVTQEQWERTPLSARLFLAMAMTATNGNPRPAGMNLSLALEALVTHAIAEPLRAALQKRGLSTLRFSLRGDRSGLGNLSRLRDLATASPIGSKSHRGWNVGEWADVIESLDKMGHHPGNATLRELVFSVFPVLRSGQAALMMGTRLREAWSLRGRIVHYRSGERLEDVRSAVSGLERLLMGGSGNPSLVGLVASNLRPNSDFGN